MVFKFSTYTLLEIFLNLENMKTSIAWIPVKSHKVLFQYISDNCMYDASKKQLTNKMYKAITNGEAGEALASPAFRPNSNFSTQTFLNF